MSLKRIRPSNLVLLAAAPFLAFLFASSSKYLRSLKAIIGIEPGAPALLVGFLLLLVLLASGFMAARRAAMSGAPPSWLAAVARLALPVHAVVITLILALPALTDPFVQSVLFHALDPAASELVDRGARPWTLKAEVLPLVSARFRIGVAAYGVLFLAFALAAARASGCAAPVLHPGIRGGLRQRPVPAGVRQPLGIRDRRRGDLAGRRVRVSAGRGARHGLDRPAEPAQFPADDPGVRRDQPPAARGGGILLGAAAGGIRDGRLHRGQDRDRQGHPAGGRRRDPLR